MEITYSQETRKKIHEIGEWLGAGSLNGFGRQFAGKDSNLEPLAEMYDVPVIGGGVILRSVEIPPEIQAIMDAGGLIPSDDYEKIVLPYLSQPDFEHKPLLLSAVGRMNGEQQGVMQATSAAGHPMRLAINFEISREESFRRLEVSPNRNRTDDTPEGLRTRLDAFDTETTPVIDFYEAEGLLITVDATPELNVVFRSFINQVHDRATGEG